MNYQKRIEIMKAAILAEVAGCPEKSLEKGIIDGFLRIEQIVTLQKEAVEPYKYFSVEHVQEGFAVWNSGGFNRRYGSSVVAAGTDGEKLRLVRYKNEINGQHSLAVIYPGCYIAVSSAADMFESTNTVVYRVEGFRQSVDKSYQACCQKVYQVSPYCSSLDPEMEERLKRLIRVSNQIATTPNLVKLRDWV